MADGARKNFQRIRDELAAVRRVWKNTHADQSGWTHEVMQKARDFVRAAPVTSATLLFVVIPVSTIALVLVL